MSRSWLVVAAGVLAVSLPLGAQASPVTYNFTSGSIALTANIGGTPIGADTIALDGQFIIFDDMTPELVDLEFTATNQGPIAIDLSAYPSFPPWNLLTIDSLSIEQPVGGFTFSSSVASGPPGAFSFLVAPLAISGTATLSDTGGYWTPASDSFTFSATVFSGSLDINAGMATLTGLELGTLDVDGAGPLPGITIKGDITFTGLPEPGAGALVALGLLALARRRR